MAGGRDNRTRGRERDDSAGQGNGSSNGNGTAIRGVALLVTGREAKRRIKLHSQQQEKAKSLSEAVVVRKTARAPDMRFAENKELFANDPSKHVNDDEPDQRFIENRPDLIELHKRRGDQIPKNLIFTDDMLPEGADELMDQLA